MDKKVLRQDRDLSTRLNFAYKKIREIWMNMVNTANNQQKTWLMNCKNYEEKKLKFYKNISTCYDNMNIRFDEDPFAKNAQGISKIYHKVLMLVTLLQTKPQVKKMDISYYELYYTVINSRDEEVNVENQYENDFFNFNDIIPSNISIEPRGTTLR